MLCYLHSRTGADTVSGMPEIPLQAPYAHGIGWKNLLPALHRVAGTIHGGGYQFMKEVVIVTTYNRPELLYLCLEAIWRDDSTMPVFVYLDRAIHWKSGIIQNPLPLTLPAGPVTVVGRQRHGYYGNSYNLLEACKEWASKVDIVHLIEDDTLVHKGYFTWARCMLRSSKIQYAAVCGRINSPHLKNWYESPCASWDASKMAQALGHLIPEYYTSSREEMQRLLHEVMFPTLRRMDGKPYKKSGAEQDRFFQMCIEYHGWLTKFPDVPLATHFGYYGYNCPPSVKGPQAERLHDRIEELRNLLTNYDFRCAMFGQAITDREMKGWDGKYDRS